MAEILWTPSPERVARSHLRRFSDSLPVRRQAYEDLRQWSVAERGAFWQAVWDYAAIIASRPPDRPLGKEAMPGTEWFPGARLNFAENLLRHRGPNPAIIAAAEDGASITISRDELIRSVAQVQQSLRGLGVGPGDRVAGLVSNTPEPIIAMAATASLGAIWSSCSPDFGPTGVVDRFGQIEPKVLIAVDGYHYNGKPFPVMDTVRTAVERIPSIDHVVIVERLGIDATLPVATSRWDQVASGPATEPEYGQFPFDHPLVVMFSSGTTGPPKSIVHGAGGTLLEHVCDHLLHFDIHPDDRLFWFTTCGWMMWNWSVSAIASGAAVVLYDGSPSHPDLGTLWRLAQRAGITHFGASPRFFSANANAGIVPRELADLSSIGLVGSTGAPLGPEQFDWIYENVGDDLLISSITGGTDLIGVFAGGVPTEPVRRGEIGARWLGMAVEAWDADGKPVVGETGELVCTAPFPSMPVAFWNDPTGERYRTAYFEQHPGVWTHGDFIEIRPEGGMIVYGRSDTTLNPGGVRIGTAEIYHVIETMPEIDDSIVVGRDLSGDVEVVLFVKPAEGVTLTPELADRIRARIRNEATPRHVPRHILEVDAIPYTMSGKKVEKAVRNCLAGRPVTNRDAIANPESLEQYRDRLTDP